MEFAKKLKAMFSSASWYAKYLFVVGLIQIVIGIVLAVHMRMVVGGLIALGGIFILIIAVTWMVLWQKICKRWLKESAN